MDFQITSQADADSVLRMVGEAANEHAKQGLFAKHWKGLSPNAQTARMVALKTWCEYLGTVNEGTRARVEATGYSVKTEDLFCTDPVQWRSEPDAWRPVTWGMVASFREWLEGNGYAVATINNKLSTIRVFAKLATRAGAISKSEGMMIAGVEGYSSKTGENLDKGREKQRTGYKKAQHTSLTRKQALDLMKQPDSPQGRRDALLMCLLLDHGLRVSEVALVERSGVDLSLGTLRFYRPKIRDWKTLEMTKRTLDAMTAYLENDAQAMGLLARASNKHGTLGAAGMSERAIQERVRVLGERVGVKGLSPHDCRHFAATWYASKKVDTLRLMEMFGWNSPAMARRYVEESKIANEGTKHLAGDD